MKIEAYRKVYDWTYRGIFELTEAGAEVVSVGYMPAGAKLLPGAPCFRLIEESRDGRHLVVAAIIGPRTASWDEVDWARATLFSVTNPKRATEYIVK